MREPTQTLYEAADALDLAVNRLASAGQLTADPLHIRWQATLAAHVRAICVLARESTSSIVPALTLARVAHELGTRLAWLSEPADEPGRAARQAAVLRSEEKFWKRVAEELARAGRDDTEATQRATEIRELRTQRLSAVAGKNSEKLPEFKKLLKQLGRRREFAPHLLAAEAIEAPQLGSSVPLGAPPTPADWYLPLALAWHGLRAAARQKVSGAPDELLVEVPATLRKLLHADVAEDESARRHA